MENRNELEAKAFLTRQVQNHEAYIRSAGARIERGDYGDVEYATEELIATGEDAGLLDRWAFNSEESWFVNLAERQARCNFYEH